MTQKNSLTMKCRTKFHFSSALHPLAESSFNFELTYIYVSSLLISVAMKKIRNIYEEFNISYMQF